VTRTRTTRLSAIYLHNMALERLARACATLPDALRFTSKTSGAEVRGKNNSGLTATDIARPPNRLDQR